MIRAASILITGFMFTLIGQAAGMSAAATFKIEQDNQRIQVIIDKKVINSKPKPVVKLKGSGGTHEVKIKVFNGRQMFITKKEIKITPGYKTDFVVLVTKNNQIEIRKASVSRLYNPYLKRPDKFFNRRYYASSKGKGAVRSKYRKPTKMEKYLKKKSPFSLLAEDWLC